MDPNHEVQNSITEEADELHSLGIDSDATGLGYVGSQEPGDLSKTIAFDIVNKLVSDNEVGSSQEINDSKTKVAMLPPILSAKAVQSLAKRADHINSLGRAGIFHWSDSLEDGENGNYFSKRKGLHPGSRGDTAGSNGQFREPRYLRSGVMDEHANSKLVEQQLETTDPDGVDVMYDVGPDTQMAAEAMETLFHGSPIDHESREDEHRVAVSLIEDSSRDTTILNTLSKDVLQRKRVSDSHAPQGTVMLSKRRKVLHTRSKVSPVPSREHSGPLRVRRKGRNKKRLGRRIKSGRKITIYSELQVIEEQHGEETETDYLIENIFRHPKRKRTRHLTLVVANSNMNKPSVSGDDVQKGSIEVGVESLPEIQDTAKLKKKTVSAHFVSENGDVPFKPNLEKDSKVFSTKPFSCKAATTDATSYCATAIMNHRMPLQEVTLPNQDADFVSHVEEAKADAKLEGSPKDKAQSFGLMCATQFEKINEIPANCNAYCLPVTSCNKSLLKPSNTRELTKLGAAESASARPLREMRRRKDLASVRVLFSNNLDGDIIKQQKKILARFGVLIATSISDATHFITNKFARTRNMLEAIAMGKSVVTHMWLESCGQACFFIDEKQYILRDPKKEKKIGFSMPVSLSRACQYPLLQGKRVFITPNVKPDRELIASLVKAAHGQPMNRIGRFATKASEVPDDLLVISCEEDYTACAALLQKGVEIFSSELLLNGIVIQKLEFERHRLFLRSCEMDHSTTW